MTSLAPSPGRAVPRPNAAAAAVGVAGALVVVLVLLAPLLALLAHLSPGGVRAALRQPGALDPLAVSLGASALAMLLIAGAGTPVAWLLARRRLPAPALWETAILLPLLMPPLVVGLLLVFVLGPATPIGVALAHLRLSATNTFLAVVVAEVYESAPYYVLQAAAAFAAVDPDLEDAAALLGDRAARRFRRVTLPLAAPGLATAFAVSWARAIGAFGAVLIIAYHPYGLPLQIWTTLQETGLASSLPFALLLLAVALPPPLAALWWSARARRRR